MKSTIAAAEDGAVPYTNVLTEPSLLKLVRAVEKGLRELGYAKS